MTTPEAFTIAKIGLVFLSEPENQEAITPKMRGMFKEAAEFYQRPNPELAEIVRELEAE